MNRLTADLDPNNGKLDPRKMSLYDDYELDGFPSSPKKTEPKKDPISFEDALAYESFDDAAIIPITEHVSVTAQERRDYHIQEQVNAYTTWYDSVLQEPTFHEQTDPEATLSTERYSASNQRDSVENTIETLMIEDQPESPSVWKKLANLAARPFSLKKNEQSS